jgi:hypothetical protein
MYTMRGMICWVDPGGRFLVRYCGSPLLLAFLYLYSLLSWYLNSESQLCDLRLVQALGAFLGGIPYWLWQNLTLAHRRLVGPISTICRDGDINAFGISTY